MNWGLDLMTLLRTEIVQHQARLLLILFCLFNESETSQDHTEFGNGRIKRGKYNAILLEI